MTVAKKEFIQALKKGDLLAIQGFIAKDESLLTQSFGRRSKVCIHLAAQSGHISLVEWLLNKKPDLLELKDSINSTALVYAAAYSHMEIVLYLLNKKAQLNYGSEYWEGGKKYRITALGWALRNGDLKIVELLFRAGAPINEPMQYHPIHIAALHGHLPIVQYLHDADPESLNAKDLLGQTPLIWACSKGKYEVVEFLIAHGASLNYYTLGQGEHQGMNALDWAYYNGHENCVNLLQDAHLNIIEKHIGTDSNKDSAIQVYLPLAALKGHIEVVKFLEEQNKEIIVKALAFYEAVKGNRIPIVEYYIKTYPQLLDRSHTDKDTALHLAVRRKHNTLVKYLLDNNASITIANAGGLTVLDLAIQLENLEAKKFILSKFITNGEIEFALAYIRKPEDVFNLMGCEPSNYKVLMNNKKIQNMMNTIEMKTPAVTSSDVGILAASQNIHVYVKSSVQNRNSLFFSCKRDGSFISDLYSKGEHLGHGTYGSVDCLSNGSRVLAIKSQHPSKEEDCQSEIDAACLEANLMEIAYPGEYYQFHFKDYYTNRFIMPLHKGKMAHIFFNELSEPHILAKGVLAACIELNRIHGIGIVHGDVHLKNVLCSKNNDEIRIVFIDFGFACMWGALTRVFFDNYIEQYAPERNAHKNDNYRLLATYDQDIYSLGYLFKQIFIDHPAGPSTLKLFPTITQFIDTYNNKPGNRPKLEDLIANLSCEVKDYKSDNNSYSI